MNIFETIDKLTNNYYCVPIIDISDQEGRTGYIDFITEDQAFEGNINVVYGVDTYQRPFYCVRGTVQTYRENVLVEEYSFFETYFKRFTDKDNIWMGCGHHGRSLLMTYGGMTPEQLYFLETLIKNNYIEIRSDSMKTYRFSTTPNTSFTKITVNV